MKKIRYIGFVLLLVVLLFAVACDETEEQENTENVSEISEEESMEDSEVVYVTAEEYREFYGLSEDFVPPEYLEEYLVAHPRTFEMLTQCNDYVSVEYFYNEGHVFGCDVSELINGNRRYATEEDDFTDVTHIILQCEEPINGTEFHQSYSIIIDKERNMYYLDLGDIAIYDYTKSEFSRYMDTETIDTLLEELRGLIIPEWEEPETLAAHNHVRWRLFLVKEDETVIEYTGYDPDEEGHPGFHEWFDKVCAVGNR